MGMSVLRRQLAWLVLLLLPIAGFAATPDKGTLTETSGTLSYTFPPEPRANASNVIEDTDPNYVCSPSDTPYACDTYELTVTLPAGYMEAHPNAIFRMDPTTTSASSDIDSQLEDTNGNVLTVTRDNPPTQPTILYRPQDGTTVYLIQIVPGSPHEGGTATVRLDAGDPPPPDGTAYAPRFQALASPANLGNSAGEPSIGYNPITKKAMYQSGLETLRVTYPEYRQEDPLNPNGLPEACDALWEDVTSPTTGTVSLDPIGFTDPTTGRNYAGQLGPKQHTMAYTDDDGENWSPSVGNFPGAAGVDHQTIGWGPYVAGGTARPLTAYPNAVYYCSQDIAYANCSRSDDGGASFLPPVPAYTTAECGGLHGHIRGGPDGTIYLPNKNCNNKQAVAVSENNGVNWQVRAVPDSSAGPTDPQMALASDGTGYFCYTDGLGLPRVAVTSDKGKNWGSSVDLGTRVGIKRAVFAQGIAGDPDRAACGFIATTTAGNYGAEDFPGIWHAYIAVTYDKGLSWSMTNVTPGDPVQGAGGICTGGTTCGANRNLLDFNEMALDEKGRAMLGFADGCVGTCVTNPGTVNRSDKAAIARFIGGKSLYKAFDRPEPHVPQAACLAGTRDLDSATLTWRAPVDNGLSAITAYKIFRGTTAADQSLLVTLSPKTKYIDFGVDPLEPEYFYRMVAINAIGESVSSNLIKLVVDVETLLQSRCINPGLTLLTDPEGDPTDAQPSHDLRAMLLAQPEATAGNPKLYFTIKAASLTALTAGSAYYTSFKSPDNIHRGVRMQVTNPAAPTFHVYVVGASSGGFFDGRFVTSQIDADPASTYNPATGVITIVADPAAVGLTAPGQFLTGFNGGVTQSSNPGGLPASATVVVDEMPNGLGRTGEFEFKSNLFCAVNTPPQAGLEVDQQSGEAPLTVEFDASSSVDSDVQDSIVEYIFDFGDGSENIVQSSPNISYTYTADGFVNAKVRVRDSRGLLSSNAAAKVIEIIPTPPLPPRQTTENNRLGGAMPLFGLLAIGFLGLLRRRFESLRA